jgi:hypothetical protein
LYIFFTDRQICTEKKDDRKTYPNFYIEITLECSWNKFVDSLELRKSLVGKSEDGKKRKRQELELYNIEFEKNSMGHDKYKHLPKDLFDFNVKSLSMQSLKLKTIDENAFANVGLSKYLQSLDLSDNELKRIDSHTLGNLKRLEHLNLAKNKLTFGERNFATNRLLKYINLANNELQFLSPNVFAGLHLLEEIDLSNNHIRTIDPCTFSNVQESPISSRFSPVEINLSGNEITCDCGVFYLNRFLNQNLNLTCARPEYYKNKTFSQLQREDPGHRCNFEKMDKACNPHEALSSRDLAFIIAIVVLASLLVLITCCCCCNSISQTGKINKLDKMLKRARRNNPKQKKVYGSDVANVEEGGKANNDQEKLIKN